jgi:protein KRI1
MPPLLSASDSEDDTPPATLQINESYAARLEHNKAREELHRLEAKYGKNIPPAHNNNKYDDDDDSEESTSESEDEVGELVTPALDAEIWRTIAMIRERRPEVYDENFKVFNEEESAPVEKLKKEKVWTTLYNIYHTMCALCVS